MKKAAPGVSAVVLQAWHPLRAAFDLIEEFGLGRDPLLLSLFTRREQAILTARVTEATRSAVSSARANWSRHNARDAKLIKLLLADKGVQISEIALLAKRREAQIELVIAGKSRTPRIRAMIATILDCAPEDLWPDAAVQAQRTSVRIRNLLEAAGLSLAELARALGRSPNHVRNVLSGKSQSIELRFKIAAALDRNAYEIWPDPKSWERP